MKPPHLSIVFLCVCPSIQHQDQLLDRRVAIAEEHFIRLRDAALLDVQRQHKVQHLRMRGNRMRR
jgi:hypothetical protein